MLHDSSDLDEQAICTNTYKKQHFWETSILVFAPFHFFFGGGGVYSCSPGSKPQTMTESGPKYSSALGLIPKTFRWIDATG